MAVNNNSTSRQCSSCGNMLAHSAYHRHQADHTGSVCPGKLPLRLTLSQEGFNSEVDTDSHASSEMIISSESSFNFNSSSEQDSEVSKMTTI